MINLVIIKEEELEEEEKQMVFPNQLILPDEGSDNEKEYYGAEQVMELQKEVLEKKEQMELNHAAKKIQCRWKQLKQKVSMNIAKKRSDTS